MLTMTDVAQMQLEAIGIKPIIKLDQPDKTQVQASPNVRDRLVNLGFAAGGFMAGSVMTMFGVGVVILILLLSNKPGRRVKSDERKAS